LFVVELLALLGPGAQVEVKGASPATKPEQAESSQEQSENSHRHMVYVSITNKKCFEYVICGKRERTKGNGTKGKGKMEKGSESRL
jgi:hypothetical protein